jgi:hypothetical protein
VFLSPHFLFLTLETSVNKLKAFLNERTKKKLSKFFLLFVITMRAPKKGKGEEL